MKKFILILFLFFTLQQTYSYSWRSYGPEGVKVNNLCFFEWSGYYLVCSDTGMYLSANFWNPTWEYFNFPAKDAVSLNNDTLLVIANEGSYSDGIYSFNLQDYQFNVIDFCMKPNFIKYYEPGGVYYVGYENGLLKSEDGLSWGDVPFFDGKNCVGLEFYANENIVVNVSAAITHLYLSDNTGADWTEATSCPGQITDMAFTYQGKLYGVFPNNSYSSGLWFSDDFGDNWEIGFYSVDMNTICRIGSPELLLTGWRSAGGEHEGIAVYDAGEPSPGLTFLNEGLPNTNINKIKYRGLLRPVGIIFACTDEGVYVCGDYFVGINEHSNSRGHIKISPNPVTDRATITINMQELSGNNNSIIIFNNSGIIVDEISLEIPLHNEVVLEWGRGALPSGVYYLAIETKNGRWVEKFIVN